MTATIRPPIASARRSENVLRAIMNDESQAGGEDESEDGGHRSGDDDADDARRSPPPSQSSRSLRHVARGDRGERDGERRARESSEVVVSDERRHAAPGRDVVEVPDEPDDLQNADDSGEGRDRRQRDGDGERIRATSHDQRHRNRERPVLGELRGADEAAGERVAVGEDRPGERRGEDERDKRRRRRPASSPRAAAARSRDGAPPAAAATTMSSTATSERAMFTVVEPAAIATSGL